MNTSLLARAARRVADFFAECNYAQRRMAALRTAPDRYVLNGDTGADTYAEFLFRTSGLLPHEPSAARRAHGQLVG
jgi:hypothetical protein